MASRVAGSLRVRSTGSAVACARPSTPAVCHAAYAGNPPDRAAPRTARTLPPGPIAPDPHRTATATRTAPHPRARSGTVWASSFLVEKGEHLLGTLITSAPEGAYFLPTLFEGGPAYAINDRDRRAPADHRSACSRSHRPETPTAASPAAARPNFHRAGRNARASDRRARSFRTALGEDAPSSRRAMATPAAEGRADGSLARQRVMIPSNSASLPGRSEAIGGGSVFMTW